MSRSEFFSRAAARYLDELDRDRCLGAATTPSGENLRRSTDGGRTWRTVASGPLDLTAMSCPSPGACLAAGSRHHGGLVLESVDGGQTFEAAPLPALAGAPLPAVAPRATRRSPVPGRPPAWRSGPVPSARWRRPPQVDTPGAQAEVASRLVGTYANAFMLEPGRCFRLVENDQARGQPVSCPHPVAVRGHWRDGGGKLRFVEACVEHGAVLEAQRPVASRPGEAARGDEPGGTPR
jgi:hypothetical protein